MSKEEATYIDLIMDAIGAGDKHLGATLDLVCHVAVRVVIQASLVAEFGLKLAAKSSK